MKKLLRKDKGDKDKSDKESKKEKKEREKKEKKERKKEAKLASKGDSSKIVQKSQETLTVVKATTISSGDDSETGKVVTQTTTIEETTTEKPNEGTVVKTTTVVKSSSEEPDNKTITKTITKDSMTDQEETSSNEDPDTASSTLLKNEEETVTIIKKDVTISPDNEETITISKTSSHVESIPSTREFLENSLPGSAMFEKTTILKESNVDQPVHQLTKTTIVRSENGDTVKTTTQVVTDETGTTTTSMTSGGNDEDGPIVSVDSDSKVNLPDWLEVRDPKPQSNEIDDSIKIPSPDLDRKEIKKPKQSGSPVKEEITPKSEEKEDISNFLDTLTDSSKDEPQNEDKQPSKTDNKNVFELMDALEHSTPKHETSTQSNESNAMPTDDNKQPSNTDENVANLMDVLETNSSEVTRPTKTAQPEIQSPSGTTSTPQGTQKYVEPASPERKITPVSSPARRPKPKTKEKVLLERHAKKLMKNGEVYETITEIFKDKDGKIETTTTTKKLEYQPQEVIDLNINLLQSKPIKGTEKKKQYEDDDPFVHEGDVINPEEVFEEILVVQRKPKVRFPKSFLPRSPERPKSWGLPLDLLVERKRSPRRSVGYMYGREVHENVQPTSKDKMTELQELDRLIEGIGASD